MKNTFLVALFSFFFSLSFAQENFRADSCAYDKAITTPEAFFGHEAGERHISHDQLVFYCRELARHSPRVELEERGRTHEGRPLILLHISSKENLEKKEEIKEAQQAMRLGKAPSADQPAVTWLGYSIHGNEASGGNAAVWVAYHLAAADKKCVGETLKSAYILLDPCMNPDGFSRFSSWVNMHCSTNINPDIQDIEHDEVWPKGRTNHYGSDLNRDWLPAVHPASQSRLEAFQDWLPLVLTDHHEMGRNSTFFFQPGIPSRTNPLTPKSNQELTLEIAKFHGKLLDHYGRPYYTRESFDDFYYGKGSTYPDANGCIGILFEQASARGHAQNTDNGLLTFRRAIHNQYLVSFSTLQAVEAMRSTLLDYRQDFYKKNREDAQKDPIKAYVINLENAQAGGKRFSNLLLRHSIAFYRLKKELKINGRTFTNKNSILIPTAQPDYRVVKAFFQELTEFQDSLFYDVSAWNIADAHGLPWAELRTNPEPWKGERLEEPVTPKTEFIEAKNPVAWAVRWSKGQAPAALYALQKRGLRVKVATKPFSAVAQAELQNFTEGTLLIPAKNQILKPEALQKVLQEVQEKYSLTVAALPEGLGENAPDLGSPSFRPLEMPRALLVVGDGTSAYDAGEVWHTLDFELGITLTRINGSDLTSKDLNSYNVIILPDGNHRKLLASEQIREWTQRGGLLLALQGGLQWAARQNLLRARLEELPVKLPNTDVRSYSTLRRDRGSRYIGGAIFTAEVDTTHPLGFGFSETEIPIFRDHETLLHRTKNPYASPLRYAKNPLRSGYIAPEQLEKLGGTASVIVGRTGRGRVIGFIDNPLFRGYWYGTKRLFINALFFGKVISGQACE